MIGRTQALSVAAGATRSRAAADFLALTKPRVVAMILVTTAIGFYLGSSGAPNPATFVLTLIGTALSAAGTLTLNQYLERDLDACMERTRMRPLPSGRLQPLDALVFGALLVAMGLMLLTLRVNALSGLVTATIVVTYLFWYTPMKRRSALCSLVGAIPGALPPVTGWVAASDAFAPGAWVLFAIMFLWQLPHSLAIAKLYADDYARAGFRLLPIVDRSGGSTERQIVINCAALVAVGLMPTVIGLAGPVYFAAALVLGLGFLACSVMLAFSSSPAAARRVLLASLVYLPLLLACMAMDRMA